MYKFLFAILIVCSFQSLLLGQQLRSEKIGEITNLVLLLPYSEFHPNLKTRICSYDLNVDILDSNKKNVYHEFEHLEFSKPDSFETEVYPFFIKRKLNPGKYIYYMRLTNKDLGDKNEQKFPLVVEAEGRKIGSLFLIGKIQDASFWIRDLYNLPSRVDSLHLKTYLGILPDSIKISIIGGHVNRIVDVSAGQLINVDIKSTLEGMHNPILKLQVFSQKVKYTKEVLSYDNSSSFSNLYSVEDQVQQLRYIMNQNELHYIRSVKPDRYKTVIEEFWKMKDPTPITKRNEFRETFEARVLESDRTYTIRNYRSGWKTDRGKILIKYGAPDEVVSDAYPLNRPPYIIWYYYAENKIFQFYDFDGWGNYQLGSVSDE
jgi:GWxTD domain-containing protein